MTISYTKVQLDQSSFPLLLSIRIRGTLGSCLVLSANTGILLIFLLGHYASYEFAPKVLIVIELIFLCVFPFFPESPQYLLKMNRAEVRFHFTCIMDISATL